MDIRNLLLLNGSPRKNGTSYSFARTLGIQAEKNNHIVNIVHVYDYFDGKETIDSLWELIAQCDCIGLIAPLYVDTLPYPDIWLLEILKQQNYQDLLTDKDFFVICQYGFPDITRSEPLLNTCEFFAKDCKMHWLGGLGYGGGPMINGTLIEDLGKQGKKITAVFDKLLDAVMYRKSIPIDCQAQFGVKIPKYMYPFLSFYLNGKAYKEAKKHGIENLYQQYYSN